MLFVGGVVFALLWTVKTVGTGLFGWFATAEAGIGFKDALLYSVFITVPLIAALAVVAGDGLIGELPTMLVAFFLFVAFFTFSLSWIF